MNTYSDDAILACIPPDGCSSGAVCRALTGDRRHASIGKRIRGMVASGALIRGEDGLLRLGDETQTVAQECVRNGPSEGVAFAKGLGGEKATPDRFAALVSACRNGISFSALCDKLDLSPARASRLLKDARAAGVAVDVAHDTVGLHWETPIDDVVSVTPAPTVGELYRCAVISDTHFGSRYCLRAQLADFLRYAYDQGCREVLHCGDILDGCYRHGVFELTHSGVDDQARDAAEVLPSLPGLTYHAITGNHEQSFAEKTGCNVGRAIMGVWRSLGRDDLTVHGARGAYLRVGGAVVHLWHPKKSEAYARTYHLQKQIEKYTAIKPQILLAGHWHSAGSCYERGVEGIAVPCWQGSGSDFAKSLGNAPSIGGLILEWRMTEHGTIRDFALRPRRYYEREAVVDVRNVLPGIEVPPAVSVPVAVPIATRWQSCTGPA